MKTRPAARRPSAAAALAADLRSVVGRIRRRLREQADLGDLTPSQVAVLLHLEREGAATVTAVARAEGVRPQSLGATMATLETAGLVAASADPSDGRQTLWSLTPAFVRGVAAGRAAREDWLASKLRSHLNAAERADLARAVALLQRIADA